MCAHIYIHMHKYIHLHIQYKICIWPIYMYRANSTQVMRLIRVHPKTSIRVHPVNIHEESHPQQQHAETPQGAASDSS